MTLRKSLSLMLLLVLCASAADAARLRQVAVLDLPGRPGFDSAIFVGKHLVLSHKGANVVEVFDPARRRVIAQIKDLQNPRGLAYDADSKRLFVALAGSKQVGIVSTSNWKLTGAIELEFVPEALLFVPEGNRLFVGNAQQQSLSVVPAQAGAQSQTIDVDGRVADLAYDPARRMVMASLQDRAQIVVLDASGQLRHRFQLAASLPTGLAFDSDARRLYIAVRHAVVVLNPETGSEIGRVPTVAGVDRLWLDKPSGTLFAAAADGSVNVIRVAGNQFVTEQEIRGNVKGRALAFDPEKQLVYVSGGQEGRSKLAIYKRFRTGERTETEPAADQIVLRK